MQLALAVDQRPGAGGGQLTIRQPQLGKQRRHRPALHERLGPQVHRPSGDQRGAQHPAELLTRIEQRDAGVVTGRRAQPVGRRQS